MTDPYTFFHITTSRFEFRYNIHMTDPLFVLKEALAQVRSSDAVAVLTHNNPDPDAIAAGFGLGHIIHVLTGARVELFYGGIIGRANNRAMVETLQIPMVSATTLSLLKHRHICLVDTQPGMRNNVLPCDRVPLLVVDHHPLHEPQGKSLFMDHREIMGSSSTIVAEYLRLLDISIEAPMATALFYGIKTDTEGLARDCSETDRDMYLALYPQVNPEWLNQIENPDLPREYYRDIGEAVMSCRVTGELLVADLQDCFTPEMPAEMADFFLRMQNVTLTFVYGTYENTIHFSLRSSRKDIRLGRLALLLVEGIGSAGGHNRAAAGQIPYEPASVRIMMERLFHFFAVEPGQFTTIY